MVAEPPWWPAARSCRSFSMRAVARSLQVRRCRVVAHVLEARRGAFGNRPVQLEVDERSDGLVLPVVKIVSIAQSGELSGSVFSHVRCREKIGIQACDTICVIRIMVSPGRVYIRFACTRTARTYANLRELTYANLHELVKSMDDSSV